MPFGVFILGEMIMSQFEFVLFSNFVNEFRDRCENAVPSHDFDQ